MENGQNGSVPPTGKQVNCLKRFVKESPELGKGILKGDDFEMQSKSEATDLIEWGYDERNGSGESAFVNGEFRLPFHT